MDFQKVITNKLFMPVVVGTVAFGSGAVTAWYLAKQHFFKHLEETIETTTVITETIEHNAQLIEAFKESDFVPEEPQEVRELKLIETRVKEEFDAVEVNVFAEVVEGWDYDEELKQRTPDAPYIIHQDEFYGDEMNFDNQTALTWYNKDKILALQDDSVVYNPYVMVGDNLRFGHGSRDPEVVFIRNEKLRTEYEVTRLDGSYEEIVVGAFEEKLAADDLRHSRAPGKFPKQE